MKIRIATIVLCLIGTSTFAQTSYDSTNYYVNKANELPNDEHNERIVYLNRAIEIAKESNRMSLFFIVPNRINEYIALNEFQLAENDYLFLLAENDKTPYFGIGDIYLGLADLYSATKKYDLAIDYYKKALSSNAMIDKYIIYLSYSKCLAETKNYDEAITNIDNGVASLGNEDPNRIQINYYKSKNNVPAEYFLLMFQRATIYFKAGKKKEGCNDLDEVLRLGEPETDIFKIQDKAVELRAKECK